MKFISLFLSIFLFSFSALSSDIIEGLKATSTDEAENERKILKSEVLISQSEERALKHLTELIGKYKGTSMEPGLRFRLAELYMSRAKSARVIDQITGSQEDEQQVMSFLPNQIKTLKEKAMVEKAISYYDSISKDFPRFRELDRVIFNKAFAQLQIEKEEEAEKSFIELLRKNKRSRLRPDTFLAVGEINFKRRNFKRALAYFNQVKKYKNARVYPYGLYKAGWSYYNLSAYEQAIQELEKVIAFGKNVEATGGDARLDLRTEALMDLALFYSGVRSASDALRYFKDLAGTKDPVPSLRKLARIHEKHGRDVEQEIVLVDLVKSFPKADSKPLMHKDLVSNYDRQNKFKSASNNLWDFRKSCVAVTERAKKEKKEVEFECADSLDSLSKRMAIKWLRLYKKDNGKQLLSYVSEQAFRVHLDGKEPQDDNSKMRFTFAEHLYERKNFKESSIEYEKVGDSTKDKKRKHDSRYASIFSWDKLHKGVYKGESEDRYRSLSSKYMKDFPKGEKYLDIAFKLGLYDYKKKNYDLAGPLLLDLGSKFYKLDKGKKSQDLYLDILNSGKKYIEIQKFSKQWRDTEIDLVRKKGLHKIYEQAFFSEVQLLQDEENYKRAITRYTEFIQENPTSVLADEAQWNMIGLHFKLKDYDTTAKSYVAYFKKYPKDKKSIPGLVKALEIFEMMAEPEQALGVSQLLVKHDIKNRARWAYLEASYLKSSGRYEDAAKRYYAIMNVAGKSEFKDVSKEEFFEMRPKLGRSSKWYYSKLQQMTLSKSREIASLAVRDISQIMYEKSDPALNKWISTHKRNRALDKSKIGRLSQFAGEKKERQFFAKRINSASLEAIIQGIQSKTKLLERVQTEYQRALGDEDAKVVMKSLLGLGRTYQRFVEDLKNVKPPASYSQEEKDALLDELDNVIMPFEEKAAEAVDQALKVATDSNLRDGSIEKVQKLLNAVNLQKKTIYPIKIGMPQALGPRGL